MSEGRTTVAVVDGRRHEIPEIWLVGFCQANRCTVQQAVAWWHEQQLMADQEDGVSFP